MSIGPITAPAPRRASPSFRLTGRMTIILAAVIALIVIYATDQIAPATSDRQAQMRIWLAARATGIVTLLLLTFQICVGLVLSHPTNKSTWKLSKRIFPWHEHVWVFVIAFLGVHIVSLILDPYAGVGVAGSFIPGLSGYRTSPVALGTLALYAFLLTAITARYTKLLPPGRVARHPSPVARRVRARLAPRDPGRHGLGRASRGVRRDGPGRRRRRRLSLLGIPPGAAHLRHVAHGGPRTMNVSSLRIRRIAHPGRGGSPLSSSGFAAIQAAAAWTATAAPLSVTPVSVKTIESKLQDEQARSADLQAQLRVVSGNTEELSTALEAAQAQIASDTQHAKDLEKDLKAAKKKLAALAEVHPGGGGGVGGVGGSCCGPA